MSERIEALGNQVFELFGACAGAPDDEATGRAADEALRALEAELVGSSAGES